MHESTQALRGKKLFLVGFTLFSMFFGAGNLIFPPFLGAQAGTALWLAFAGFAVSAIGLPIASVAAVARAGEVLLAEAEQAAFLRMLTAEQDEWARLSQALGAER